MSTGSIPSINDRVWIDLPCCPGSPHPSRVEDGGEGWLDIAAPLHIEDEVHGGREIVEADRPEVEQVVTLLWTETKGFFQLPVRLASATNGDLPVWTLRLLGSPEVSQRRSFVRVEEVGTVTLLSGTETYEAYMLDLSEGGMRCLVDCRVPTYHENVVGTIFECGDTLLRIDAEVVRQEPADSGRYVLGLRFTDVSSAEADTIRRHVFGRQIQYCRREAS